MRQEMESGLERANDEVHHAMLLEPKAMRGSRKVLPERRV